MPPAAPSADWYPDPSDAERDRWWSGEAWTEHVRARAVAPAVAPAVQPALDGPAFSAAVDPDVANRYRVATAATPTAFTPESAPVRPLGDSGFPGHPSPAPWTGGSAQPTISEPNRIATQALISGAVAVGFALFNTFSGFIATGALITGAIALVQGIVGAVRASRLGAGKGQAIGAIVAGSVAVLIVVGSFVGAVVTAMTQVRHDVDYLEQEIVSVSAGWGIMLSSSQCPDEPPAVERTSFTCNALGTDGTTYTVTVTNESDGYYSWVIE